jgi:hypothetical protein
VFQIVLSSAIRQAQGRLQKAYRVQRDELVVLSPASILPSTPFPWPPEICGNLRNLWIKKTPQITQISADYGTENTTAPGKARYDKDNGLTQRMERGNSDCLSAPAIDAAGERNSLRLCVFA